MVFSKIVVGASLFFLALAIAPVANARNAGDGVGVSQSHRVVDPERKAARKAKRQQRREMRRQMRLQQRGFGPAGPSIYTPR